jgi:hypothetical protein
MQAMILTLILLFIVPAMLSGCTPKLWKYPGRSDDLTTELKALESELSSDVYQKYYEKPDSEKTNYRNKVVYARIAAIDLCYTKFEQEVSWGTSLTKVGVDWTTLGLTGAGAVFPHASYILSAITTGIKGATLSVEKNIFYEKTMPVILYKMEAMRSKKKADILEKIRKKEDKDYPLPEALQDLEEYFKAGTIACALTEIVGKSTEEKKQAEGRIDQLQLMPPAPAPEQGIK